MDKLQWFKFSYADWRMGKIQRCSEITQARFVNLCCLYWNKEANVSIEDAEIEIDKEHLDILICKKIIEVDNQHIFIKFLDEQLKDIAETSKGKSKAAKARWEKYKKDNADAMQNDADAMHVHKSAMQNDAEKRREEKRRKDEIEIELNNSQVWKEGIAKLNKCKLIEVEKFLVIFLEGQELDDNLDRDLQEVKKHFRAWFKKQDFKSDKPKRTIAL
jgi:hypothetical protein